MQIVSLLTKNKFFGFLALSTLLHFACLILLHESFILAPDEERYLFTFNNLYTDMFSSNSQYASGWTYAPRIFLLISYLPAKLLTLLGISSLLSIRLLAFAHYFICCFILLYLQKEMSKENDKKKSNLILFLLTPSILLWTTLGLRESFLILSTLSFFSAFYLYDKKNSNSMLLWLSLASFCVLSIKYYQWSLLAISLIIFCFIKLAHTRDLLPTVKMLLASVLIPLLVFIATAPSIAKNIGVNVNFDAISSRSGNSITVLSSEKVESILGSEPKYEQEAYVSDSTAIQLLDSGNSNSNLFKLLKYLGLISLMRENLVDSFVNDGSKSKSTHVLEPGRVSQPLSIILPSFIYYFGPVLHLDVNLFQALILLESPIWWLLTFLVLIKIFLAIKEKEFELILKNVPAIIYVLLHSIVAGIVEVNVGTAARHKSVLIIPLLMVLVSMNSLKHQKRSIF